MCTHCGKALKEAVSEKFSCVAAQEFEDLQDVVASQELILRFSATPEIAGNLPVKKKATHITPEAPGASKVTKLERGDILYGVTKFMHPHGASYF